MLKFFNLLVHHFGQDGGFLPVPVEYIWLTSTLPRNDWLAFGGAALGISLGYSSLVGLASTLILLLPSMLYRMRKE